MVNTNESNFALNIKDSNANETQLTGKLIIVY